MENPVAQALTTYKPTPTTPSSRKCDHETIGAVKVLKLTRSIVVYIRNKKKPNFCIATEVFTSLIYEKPAFFFIIKT